jgi:hypothetical protein
MAQSPRTKPYRNAPSSVVSLINSIFPEGTRAVDEPAEGENEEEYGSLIGQAPDWPPDLFAVYAHLLHTAGAYHYLTPGGIGLDSSGKQPEIVVSRAEITRLRDIGKRWYADDPKNEPADQSEIEELWATIVTSDDPVCSDPSDESEMPDWWTAALRLMIIADETCFGVGYLTGGKRTWIRDALTATIKNAIEEDATPDEIASGHYRSRAAYSSICARASREVVCVLPKALTPGVGMTMRSLSQNLAYLPPTGVVEGVWTDLPIETLPDPSKAPINLLVVPFPYVLDDSAISARPWTAPGAPTSSAKRWSWFEISQSWLPQQHEVPQFLDFIDRLLAEAQKARPDPIHVLVFPEFSLSRDVHQALVQHLMDNHRTIEAVIAGSSTNCLGRIGNHTLTTQFFDLSEDDGVSRRVMVSHSRSKHHRWRIDASQLKEYQLQLKPDVTYWESITIPRRRFHTHHFRERSIFTTLICEDLARPEPCHQYIRAVGPNLVFVLLMDGVQIESRWPARHALTLADDTGSAVLTLTSRALVKRSNRHSTVIGRAQNWSVGLWRDAISKPHELQCDEDHQAVLLKIQATANAEITVDGRYQKNGWTYALSGFPLQIGLDRSNTEDRALLARFVER